MSAFFESRVEFLKGVGPSRAALLNKELNIFTFGDLIQHYPFRYEDRTRFYRIADIREDLPYIQLKGTIRHVEVTGSARRKRLMAWLADDSGEVELIWFQGIQWIARKLVKGAEYVVFGKPSLFNRRFSLAHPELTPAGQAGQETGHLQPIYSTTEKLKLRYIDSRYISRLQRELLSAARGQIRETLPAALLRQYGLCTKESALRGIHFPADARDLQQAQYRLKFEELFYVQLRLLKLKITRIEKFKGKVFDNTALLTRFYQDHLPFDLTGAQKRVVREIFADLKSGRQMNRLVQGDVGSGKTMVAFLAMLLVLGGDAQVAMMAPTEILAQQHYTGLEEYCLPLDLRIALLRGSTKKAERERILSGLLDGSIQILVGTHALIEESVQFANLGLAVVDEQHRFGVAQRARLWKKNQAVYPHILVMTATPIPRTLALTLYGDLDVSVIDEMPAGRKTIQTVHKYDSDRLWLFGFIRSQVQAGRQVYVVYPLIEESEKLDLKHLTDGYEAICRAFPEIHVGILHGRMKTGAKELEMKRFLRNETRIMVSTTVIEVGVNVPNATVMVIENAERFGLAQLHQLRGRVGRGAEQSYCILVTGHELTRESRQRIRTMCSTGNGFEIAEADLKLRGPGDLMGTQQSGVLDLLIADLGQDGKILELARGAAGELLERDPELGSPEHAMIRQQVRSAGANQFNWSRIS